MNRAIVLAGGQGTRLRPYTTILPKPLMPVGDRPVLDVVVRQLRAAGFEQVTMATGHLAELIEAYFGDGAKLGIQIDYVREEHPLGTAGPLSLLEDFTEDVLVMNGDILTDLDYRALLSDHCADGAVATIATQRRTEAMSLGVVTFGDDADDVNRVIGYDEKPELAVDASMGVYCFSPAVLEHVEPGRFLDFPDLVLRLIAADVPVRGWRSSAFWLDVGTPADYESAQEAFVTLRHRLLPPD